MATMTISLPEQMKNHIENLTKQGEYSSTSDYVRDLVRKDLEKRNSEITIDELRNILSSSRESGIGNKTPDEIFNEAVNIVKPRKV